MSAPPALQVTVSDPFAPGREPFEDLLAHLGSETAQGMSHSDMERDLGQRGQELLRQLYQGWLDQQAESETDTEVVDAEGTERPRKREHDRALQTVFGTVRVKRTGYGAEGKASLHPLDGQLNLPDEVYSHQLRRRVAEEASKSSFDEAVETIKQYTGAAIPKRQVEELVQRAAQDFDAFYQTRRREAAGVRQGRGSLLVVTVDAKGVVVLQQDLRPATRQKAQQQRPKLTTRLTKGEKPNRKRMATITAVYTVAPHVRTPEQVFGDLARQPICDQRLPRPRPEAKRVAASLVQTPEEMLEEAFQEGMDRDPQRQKTWAAVVDGNDTQLRLLKKLAKKHQIELTIVLDVIHVLDYVWKAGHAFHADASQELEHWVL
ncbi:ISKra4 family transposase, partial [bacterium]|nr:ISKra4 family transposase [bacterium]